MAAEKGCTRGAARARRATASRRPRPAPEVIVAVRDEEATLPVLLESLRAQTRGDCPVPVRRRPLRR